MLFGIGLIWLYVRTPIYATIRVIVLVIPGRFLPILVRMSETALIQIGRELQEAAAVATLQIVLLAAGFAVVSFATRRGARWRHAS